MRLLKETTCSNNTYNCEVFKVQPEMMEGEKKGKLNNNRATDYAELVPLSGMLPLAQPNTTQSDRFVDKSKG